MAWHWKPAILSSVKICAIKYLLFTGREVRIGKNRARGLEYGPRPHWFFILIYFEWRDTENQQF